MIRINNNNNYKMFVVFYDLIEYYVIRTMYRKISNKYILIPN